jgi:hypothetical protein
MSPASASSSVGKEEENEPRVSVPQRARMWPNFGYQFEKKEIRDDVS